MNILIDECVPRKFKFDLITPGRTCSTVQEAGYAGKRNGALLALAETKFDVFITLDKNLPSQQNVTGRKIAIIIIRARSSRLSDVRQHLMDCVNALARIVPGQIVFVGTSR